MPAESRRDIRRTAPTPDPDHGGDLGRDNDPLHRDTGQANTSSHESDNPADDPPHPVQPPGQATSPASDTDAKEHQRTGEPNDDPNASESDMQRMTLTLPRSTADRIRAHADANGMNQSEAAADLLKPPAGGGPGFHQNY